MKIVQLYYPPQWGSMEFSIPQKQVIAIGDFDGVHLGHRHVIGRALAIAKQENIPAAIMTFNPHPREVLGQAKYSRYLAPIQNKMQMFAELGIDYTYIVTFDQAFAQISPETFVQKMLAPLNAHTIVVGFDFTFGHKGVGTAHTLKQLGAGHMDVKVVEPFQKDGEKVSSTLIREQLYLGELDRIKEYLGRNYSISGMVVSGDQRGREIGFPTANLEVTVPYVIPRHGVYAVYVHIEDVQYRGVMNIGTRPTFSNDELHPRLEVHILDFNEQLYGQRLTIEFIKFLRAEEKFASIDLLVKQIQLDVEKARHLLS